MSFSTPRHPTFYRLVCNLDKITEHSLTESNLFGPQSSKKATALKFPKAVGIGLASVGSRVGICILRLLHYTQIMKTTVIPYHFHHYLVFGFLQEGAENTMSSSS